MSIRPRAEGQRCMLLPSIETAIHVCWECPRRALFLAVTFMLSQRQHKRTSLGHHCEFSL